MPASFPFLRLPFDLQVEVFKHCFSKNYYSAIYANTYSSALEGIRSESVFDYRRDRSDRLFLGRIKEAHRDLEGPATKALAYNFNGSLYIETGDTRPEMYIGGAWKCLPFLEFPSERVKHISLRLLPAKLPLATWDVRSLDSLFSQGWTKFAALFADPRLCNLQKLEANMYVDKGIAALFTNDGKYIKDYFGSEASNDVLINWVRQFMSLRMDDLPWRPIQRCDGKFLPLSLEITDEDIPEPPERFCGKTDLDQPPHPVFTVDYSILTPDEITVVRKRLRGTDCSWCNPC